MNLSDVPIGRPAVIMEIRLPHAHGERLAAFGLCAGARVTPLLRAYGIRAYRVRGMLVGIRKSDAAQILVTSSDPPPRR